MCCNVTQMKSKVLSSFESENSLFVPAAPEQEAAEGEAKNWASVLEQAETTIKCVDQPGLLAWLGVKSDTSENAAEVKKEMEKIKTHLVEALAAKGEAMIELGETDKEKLLGVYSDIVKYTDANDNKVMLF